MVHYICGVSVFRKEESVQPENHFNYLIYHIYALPVPDPFYNVKEVEATRESRLPPNIPAVAQTINT